MLQLAYDLPEPPEAETRECLTQLRAEGLFTEPSPLTSCVRLSEMPPDIEDGAGARRGHCERVSTSYSAPPPRSAIASSRHALADRIAVNRLGPYADRRSAGPDTRSSTWQFDQRSSNDVLGVRPRSTYAHQQQRQFEDLKGQAAKDQAEALGHVDLLIVQLRPAQRRSPLQAQAS